MLASSTARQDHAPHPGPEGARRGRGEMLLPALVYALLLVGSMWPRLGQLATHLPRSPNEYDAQLIAWILSWVVHAATDPTATVLDANINHPAAAQLTGSDYFLSPLLLFAPLLWLSDNAVLALNVTALAMYWLAGVCCERLLRALGCTRSVAFVGGAVYLFGAPPFNVHLLQYPLFLLPALALTLTRLRERPDLRRAAAVCAVYAFALLCSVYAAMLCSVTAVLWALAELARSLPRRGRFVALGLGAAAVAALPLLPLARAYVARAATQGLPLPTEAALPLLDRLVNTDRLTALVLYQPAELVLALIAVMALAGLVRRGSVARRIVPVALACVIVGSILAYGVPSAMHGTVVADLFQAVRYPHRFSVVTGFGTVLLLATGVDTMSRWLPRGLRLAPALVALGTVLLGRSMLDAAGLREVGALGRDRALHRTVGQIVAARGRGPLLVLPSDGVPQIGDKPSELLQPDAMLATTLHWLPLVDGYTGHQPPHRLLLATLIRALPEPAALADLVDLTHLRWILLRPAAVWLPNAPRAPFERALRASPDIGGAWQLDDWTLLEVVRTPQHPDWFATVAATPRLDTTVLGAPLAPLPAGSDIGTIEAPRALPAALPALRLFPTYLTIHNGGAATWPVNRAPQVGLILDFSAVQAPLDDTVVLRERWVRLDAAEPTVIQRDVRLRRDVPAGETLLQRAILVTPRAPGRYRLELSLAQVGGADFSGPGNIRLEHELDIIAAPLPGTPAKPAATAID